MRLNVRDGIMPTADSSSLLLWSAIVLSLFGVACSEDPSPGTSLDVSVDQRGPDAVDALEDGRVANEDVLSDVIDAVETVGASQDFPEIQTGATGVSEAIEFVVSETTAAFAISVVGEPETFYVIEDLVAPDGSVLLSAGWTQDASNFGGAQLCLNCEIRAAAAESAHAVLVPNTPVGKSGSEVRLVPGTYRFRVAAFKLVAGSGFQPPTVQPMDSVVNVKVAFQAAEVLETTPLRLDLNLHFTGANGITAAVAQDDARIQAGIEEMEAAYAQADLVFGEVRYLDLDTLIQTVESMTGPGNDFEALARLTESSPPGVNLIFVREIVESSSPFGGLGVILGVSGGIPGPVGLQGSGRSAVLIALEEVSGDSEVPGIGHTMAHEVGHYLGLFHSSELPFLGLHDPLPDTPENDQQNLMFFSGLGDQLTPQQTTVLRNNPWVHP